MDFLKKLFETDFMPHGHCYFWKPEIVYTNAISDAVIAIAYFTIPITLIYLIRKRKDFRYYWMIVLFAIFILGCGATHVMDVINIWNPIYRLDSGFRVITALASIGTAVMLIKISPKILLIPDSDVVKKMNEELLVANKELENSFKEIAMREEQLKLLNSELEAKVESRAKELKESETRFRTMADNIPNLAWMADAGGYIYWYNKRWYEYTGTGVDQMKGWGWQSVHDVNELPSVMKAWKESISSGSPFEMIFPIKGTNGSFRPFLTRVMPVKDENGKTIQWFGTNTDISEQIENEKKLELKNSELLKINADLDNFVYTASHDLKAPISNIEGLVNNLPDLIPDELSSKKIFQEILDMITISIQKFKITINDLTQISKVQKNTYEDVEYVNVEEIVEDVTLLLNDEIKKSNAEIKIDTSARSEIRFSKKNLNSIIYNLLSNAIKYKSPDRSPRIAVKTKVSGSHVILFIEDNGLGFPKGKVDKAFGMFKRLHDHVEGTGVGLYIVKRIMDNAGGKIEVDTEEGKGSTFKIYFNI